MNTTENIKNFLPIPIQHTDEKKRRIRIEKNVLNNWEGQLHDHDPKEYYKFIYNLMSSYGFLTAAEIDKILDKDGMKIMTTAVTHWSLREEEDYDIWETLGDSTLNKIMIWYMYRRFPHASSEQLTEAKKINVSKGQFPIYAQTLQLPQYVRYKNIQYQSGKNILTISLDKSMKEDTFEAFFGALEFLIDSKIILGSGYLIVYNIVTHILDQQQMTIDLSKIKDSITQLKEIFDSRKKLGDSYTYSYDYNTKKETVILMFNRELDSPVKMKDGKNPHIIKLEVTNVSNEKDGQRKASEKALVFLKDYCNIDWQSSNNK